LFPIFGGIIADKLIGTHRSMVIGAITIALGHVALAISGLGELDESRLGTSTFILGLCLIVFGTGHFKPCVSVMVGQLYPEKDPRRDGAYSIFYMGINLGAFLCNFVCGILAYRVGWHWGFGSAAVGMLAGLALYLFLRNKYLRGIGEPKDRKKAAIAPALVAVALALSAVFAGAFHVGVLGDAWDWVSRQLDFPNAAVIVPATLLLFMIGLCTWFTMINAPEDRAPVASIFIYMFFNAFFWIAFEQAGSSVTLFTERYTDREYNILGMSGTVDTPLFQSINPALIILFAPLFGLIWTKLGKRNMNPSQPVKIAMGLMLLGLGYVFIFMGAMGVRLGPDGAVIARASMLLVFSMYFWHTMGELCLSPTGLSYVTKVAPVRFVSLLMGIWFISSFIANLGGGLLAAQVEAIDRGEITMPWNFEGQNSNFFFLFVVTSFASGLAILIASPWLKKLARGRE
jgi:POT family proton-dependent oligopeptide transporter